MTPKIWEAGELASRPFPRDWPAICLPSKYFLPRVISDGLGAPVDRYLIKVRDLVRSVGLELAHCLRGRSHPRCPPDLVPPALPQVKADTSSASVVCVLVSTAILIALRTLSVEHRRTARPLLFRTCSCPGRSRPHPKALPYFLIHRNVFAGFDGNRQSIPD